MFTLRCTKKVLTRLRAKPDLPVVVPTIGVGVHLNAKLARGVRETLEVPENENADSALWAQSAFSLSCGGRI